MSFAERREDETVRMWVSRLWGQLDYEQEDLLDDLPSFDAVLDFCRLWDIYGVDYLQGVLEEIAEGHQPPDAYNDFVRKYNLDWDIIEKPEHAENMLPKGPGAYGRF